MDSDIRKEVENYILSIVMTYEDDKPGEEVDFEEMVSECMEYVHDESSEILVAMAKQVARDVFRAIGRGGEIV